MEGPPPLPKPDGRPDPGVDPIIGPTIPYEAADPFSVKTPPFAATRALCLAGFVIGVLDVVRYVPYGIQKLARAASYPTVPFVLDEIRPTTWTDELSILAAVVQWTIIGLLIDGMRRWSRRG